MQKRTDRNGIVLHGISTYVDKAVEKPKSGRDEYQIWVKKVWDGDRVAADQ